MTCHCPLGQRAFLSAPCMPWLVPSMCGQAERNRDKRKIQLRQQHGLLMPAIQRVTPTCENPLLSRILRKIRCFKIFIPEKYSAIFVKHLSNASSFSKASPCDYYLFAPRFGPNRIMIWNESSCDDYLIALRIHSNHTLTNTQTHPSQTHKPYNSLTLNGLKTDAIFRVFGAGEK